MKKITLIIFFLLSTSMALSNVNDSLKLINDVERDTIKSKIETVLENKKFNVYVNTLMDGESFKVLEPEKVIIINIKKAESGEVGVELSFSRDIEVDEYKDDIDDILENNKDILLKGEFSNYVSNILDDLNPIFDSIDQQEKKEAEIPQETNVLKWLYISLGVIGLIIVSLFLKKQFKEKPKE